MKKGFSWFGLVIASTSGAYPSVSYQVVGGAIEAYDRGQFAPVPVWVIKEFQKKGML